ncbi:hypothetical protein BC829DRAFT_389382 [Chytridium lagenaria]|nr:hypothetical protein BC829DRAFT_389382 [Chytridium lagenaria]
MSLKRFITKHFGIPTAVKDLEFLVRIRPDLAPTIVPVSLHAETAPCSNYVHLLIGHSQPDFIAPKNEAISKNYYFNRDTRRSYPLPQILLSSGSKPQLTAGDASAPSGVATTTESLPETQGEFFPPVINQKYRWKNSMPHLKPDETNPQMCIRGMN